MSNYQYINAISMRGVHFITIPEKTTLLTSRLIINPCYLTRTHHLIILIQKPLINIPNLPFCHHEDTTLNTKV